MMGRITHRNFRGSLTPTLAFGRGFMARPSNVGDVPVGVDVSPLTLPNEPGWDFMMYTVDVSDRLVDAVVDIRESVIWKWCIKTLTSWQTCIFLRGKG